MLHRVVQTALYIAMISQMVIFFIHNNYPRPWSNIFLILGLHHVCNITKNVRMTFSKMLRIVRQLQGPINQMFVFISFIVENEVFGC